MAKSGGKQTRNIAGTNKIGKAGLYNGSAKCSKPRHFPPCIYHGQCQYTQANEYHFGGARTMQDTKVSCTYHIYIYIYIRFPFVTPDSVSLASLARQLLFVIPDVQPVKGQLSCQWITPSPAPVDNPVIPL